MRMSLAEGEELGSNLLQVAEIDTQPYELLRMRHVLNSENGPDGTSILSRSEVEMRGLMGAGFMFHALLRLGRSRRTQSHTSANRVHRDWPWRDKAWSHRGWESRDCRAPTASSGRPG